MKTSPVKTRANRKQPLSDQIYRLVRSWILTGKIRPGGVVDDKLIAAKLKVSRTPVREAIKKLSDEHLIDVIAQSGTRASLINRHEVEQAYIIRRALEMECAAQAAKNVTVAQIKLLTDILTTHSLALKRKNFVLAIETDDRFHRTISEISNLPRLWRAIEISKAPLDRCRHMMMPRVGEAQATLEQHKAIIRALIGKNPDKARAAMGQHLERAFANTIKVLNVETPK